MAETFGVLPRMQLINRISGVDGVTVVKPMDNGQSHKHGEEFSQCFEKECSKAVQNQASVEHKQDMRDLKVVVMDGDFEIYNNLAKTAHYYMTVNTTDLKG